MTKEQFDSLYYGKAVHCDTYEKAKEFLALADSVGYEWTKGVKATEFTNWRIFKDDTHYFLGFFWDGIYIECGRGGYYLKQGIDCIEFIPQSQKLKYVEPKETTETLIDEIKAKWGEINILLNRLEKIEKGE